MKNLRNMVAPYNWIKALESIIISKINFKKIFSQENFFQKIKIRNDQKKFFEGNAQIFPVFKSFFAE